MFSLLRKNSAPTAKVNTESYNLVLQANHFRQRNTKTAVERAVRSAKEEHRVLETVTSAVQNGDDHPPAPARSS